jgi:hypothetical protein
MDTKGDTMSDYVREMLNAEAEMYDNSKVVGTITTTLPITEAMVDCILVGAFDGSYGVCYYWAELNNLVVKKAETPDGFDRWQEVTITDIVERDEGSGEVNVYTINAENITKAIQQFLDDNQHMANNTITGYIRRAVQENDPGMIDGDAADCIVQVAAFGTVLYG